MDAAAVLLGGRRRGATAPGSAGIRSLTLTCITSSHSCPECVRTASWGAEQPGVEQHAIEAAELLGEGLRHAAVVGGSSPFKVHWHDGGQGVTGRFNLVVDRLQLALVRLSRITAVPWAAGEEAASRPMPSPAPVTRMTLS